MPFVNKFPKNTELYKLMTTKPSELHDQLQMQQAPGGLTEQQRMLLAKIQEVAKTTEDFDLLVSKYLPELAGRK